MSDVLDSTMATPPTRHVYRAGKCLVETAGGHLIANEGDKEHP